MAELSTLDLAFPATTNASVLAAGVADVTLGKMTVVLATYLKRDNQGEMARQSG